MRARYTGCFVNFSGKLQLCDPRATETAREYYNINPSDYGKMYNAPKGLYNAYTNLYVEKVCQDENMAQACFSSHMAVIPDNYNGEEVALLSEDMVNIGLSRVICLVDDKLFDHPEYSSYGVLSDAVYNIHDLLHNGTSGFIHSNMEPLEALKEEYITGSALLDTCSGVPELSSNKIRSTHWSEDTIYRAQLMNDLGAVIYGGVACTANACKTIASIYSFKNGIILICSLLNTDDWTDLAALECDLRNQFINVLRSNFYKMLS